MSAGEGLAILVNANAKRGGRRVAAQLKRALPGANVALTKRIEEIEGWLQSLGEVRGILAAGGDGSAVALLNALRAVRGNDFPPVGALPLGTGNAWAHALGARKLAGCVKALQNTDGPLPTRRYGLLECNDTLTFFAGSGWDAQILDDYRLQVQRSKGPLRQLSKSVYGYLSAIVTQTAPKSFAFGRPNVTIENLGDELLALDHSGAVVKVAATPGLVVYDGPVSCVGCATCPEFGFRFRAFPLAERFPKLMNLRIYDQTTVGALADIPKLWRGTSPMHGMFDWFAKHIRMTFSRPVPLQIAGEAIGMKQVIEYRAFEREIQVIDWRGLFR